MQKRKSHFGRPRSCQNASGHCRPRGGFTLLELLLVLSILVVIGGIAMINLGSADVDAKIKTTQAQINSIDQAIEFYKIRMSTLPQSLDELRDGPSDAGKKSRWTGSIMERVPVDAWENDFVFSVNGNTYEIRSAGVDGQINTDDDIVQEGS
jgi:general secretion pathway protein G